MPIVDNPAALSCGCNHQQNFPSMGSGEGFEWDPSGVTFGIDFTTDRIFDGETVTDDYSTVLGGGFDEGEVSSLGMAVFADPGTHHPNAVNDLLAKLQTLDYAVVIYWRQQQVQNLKPLLTLLDVDEADFVEISFDDNETFASNFNGDYSNVGVVRSFSDNALAVSFNGDGILASLNGETAVLSTPPQTEAIVSAPVGYRDNDELEGWIKAIIFYPATNAAGVEAYSANTAPTNTAAPAITGTAQVGQQLSVSTGTWTDSPTSYQYQWYRDNFNEASAIVGATASTYQLTGAEEGVTMKCVVYALNADGIGGIPVSDDETVIAA